MAEASPRTVEELALTILVSHSTRGGETDVLRIIATMGAATAVAAEDSVLLRIDGPVFLDALDTAPPSASFIQLTGTRWARTASGSAGG